MSGELGKGLYIKLGEARAILEKQQQDFLDRAKAKASLEEFRVKGGTTLDELKKETGK